MREVDDDEVVGIGGLFIPKVVNIPYQGRMRCDSDSANDYTPTSRIAGPRLNTNSHLPSMIWFDIQKNGMVVSYTLCFGDRYY